MKQVRPGDQTEFAGASPLGNEGRGLKLLDGGYDAAAARPVAVKGQEIVNGGSLCMTVSSSAFPTGQALFD